MVSSHDPRHNSRVLCLERLFENDFSTSIKLPESKSVLSDSFVKFDLNELKSANEISSYNVNLFEDIFSTVIAKSSEIDNLIQKFAKERPISEISKIDLNILRISIAEVLFLKVTPVKVSIDEAVELAKEFGGMENGSFVNGVLDQIFKSN